MNLYPEAVLAFTEYVFIYIYFSSIKYHDENNLEVYYLRGILNRALLEYIIYIKYNK